MNGSRVDRGPHIDDGDLIRLLDGECPTEEAGQIRAHIEDCSECSENFHTLKNASERFSSLLAELDVSAPREVGKGSDVGTTSGPPESRRFRFFSPRVLSAAAVLAAMVLVLAATPARAWLFRGWEALRSLVTSETNDVPVETAAPEATGPEISSVIRFTPRGPTFRLEFTNRPAAGTVVLLFDSVATASAGLVGGDGTEGIILLPYGLRVHTSPSSTASYELRLPMSLSSAHVFIAGSVELIVDVRSATGPFRRELDLSGEQGR